MAISSPFQSSRPVWGETAEWLNLFRLKKRFQSSRPVWGETGDTVNAEVIEEFQSSRPVWGETHRRADRFAVGNYFNPLAPCGARRGTDQSYTQHPSISILSPRVGRDNDPLFAVTLPVEISILSPRVGRDPLWTRWTWHRPTFQSSRPVWGETAKAHNLIMFKLCVFDKSKTFSSA